MGIRFRSHLCRWPARTADAYRHGAVSAAMTRWLLALLLLASPALAAEFTAAERAQIERIGPWPPAFAPDPGKRLSGQPPAIAFGEALFAEQIGRALCRGSVLQYV